MFTPTGKFRLGTSLPVEAKQPYTYTYVPVITSLQILQQTIHGLKLAYNNKHINSTLSDQNTQHR